MAKINHQPKSGHKPHVKLAAAFMGGVGLFFSLTSCGSNDAPSTPPTSGSPAPAVTEPATSSETSGTQATSGSQQGEQLDLDGEWVCVADSAGGPLYYPFEVNGDGIDFDDNTDNGDEATLTVVGTQATWSDYWANSAGWEVTIDLNNGSFDGASGHYTNNYVNKTYTITDCQPASGAE